MKKQPYKPKYKFFPNGEEISKMDDEEVMFWARQVLSNKYYMEEEIYKLNDLLIDRFLENPLEVLDSPFTPYDLRRDVQKLKNMGVTIKIKLK